VYITTTHEALAALLTTATYHQLEVFSEDTPRAAL